MTYDKKYLSASDDEIYETDVMVRRIVRVYEKALGGMA